MSNHHVAKQIKYCPCSLTEGRTLSSLCLQRHYLSSLSNANANANARKRERERQNKRERERQNAKANAKTKTRTRTPKPAKKIVFFAQENLLKRLNKD
jgi:hypothetical protein